MRITLEPLEPKHLEFVRCLRNDLRRHFFDSKPVSKEQQRFWYRRYMTNSLRFYILRYSRQNIGTISIQLRQGSHLAYYEIGHLMLLPAYQGQGFMSEALEWLMASHPHAFFVAHVKEDNAASIGLFERAGFWRVPK